MMKLQQEEGFNPLAGCLPMFLQIPVFIGLYHVLRHLSNSNALCTDADSHSQPADALHLQLGRDLRRVTGQDLRRTAGRVLPGLDSVIRNLGGDPSTTRIVLVILLIISAIGHPGHPAAGPGERHDDARGHGRHRPAADALADPGRHAGLGPAVQLPARRAAVLVHQQPVDAGPAGLHHPVPPADRGAEDAGRRARQGAGPEARPAPGAHAEARRRSSAGSAAADASTAEPRHRQCAARPASTSPPGAAPDPDRPPSDRRPRSGRPRRRSGADAVAPPAPIGLPGPDRSERKPVL